MHLLWCPLHSSCPIHCSHGLVSSLVIACQLTFAWFSCGLRWYLWISTLIILEIWCLLNSLDKNLHFRHWDLQGNVLSHLKQFEIQVCPVFLSLFETVTSLILPSYIYLRCVREPVFPSCHGHGSRPLSFAKSKNNIGYISVICTEGSHVSIFFTAGLTFGASEVLVIDAFCTYTPLLPCHNPIHWHLNHSRRKLILD